MAGGSGPFQPTAGLHRISGPTPALPVELGELELGAGVAGGGGLFILLARLGVPLLMQGPKPSFEETLGLGQGGKTGVGPGGEQCQGQR